MQGESEPFDNFKSVFEEKNDDEVQSDFIIIAYYPMESHIGAVLDIVARAMIRYEETWDFCVINDFEARIDVASILSNLVPLTLLRDRATNEVLIKEVFFAISRDDEVVGLSIVDTDGLFYSFEINPSFPDFIVTRLLVGSSISYEFIPAINRNGYQYWDILFNLTIWYRKTYRIQ